MAGVADEMERLDLLVCGKKMKPFVPYAHLYVTYFALIVIIGQASDVPKLSDQELPVHCCLRREMAVIGYNWL